MKWPVIRYREVGGAGEVADGPEVGQYFTVHHLAKEYGPGVLDQPADEVAALLLIDDILGQYQAEQNKKAARGQRRARRR